MAVNADAAKAKATEQVVARVYLIRHGETQENRDGIVQGQMDTQLNAHGKWQAQLLGAHAIMTNIRIAKMMTSDLSRAVESAAHVLASHPDVELIKQPELRERGMGQLEGIKGGPGLAKASKEGPAAELPSAFAKRTVDWWKRQVVDWCRPRAAFVAEDYTGPKDIVVMTHGGFILALVQALLGSRKATLGDGVTVGRCYNTSVTEIDVLASGKGVIRSFGRIDHLSEPGDALGSNADVDEST